MANRCLLHRSKLQEFITWLGHAYLPPAGPFEVVRWKGPRGQPMRIIFNGSSPEHLSVNDAAWRDVRRFIRGSRHV